MRTAASGTSGTGVGLLLAAAVLAAAGPPAARPADVWAAGTSCERQEGRTVVANRAVRVYRRATSQLGRRTYACFGRSGKVTPLGDLDSLTASTGVSRVTLSGRFLAYSMSTAAGPDVVDRTVVRMDVATGRRDLLDPAAGLDAELTTRPHVAVARDGTVAWISPLSGPTFAVYIARGRAASLVDQGPDIEPTSLALAPGYAYWTRGGVAKSVALRRRE